MTFANSRKSLPAKKKAAKKRKRRALPTFEISLDRSWVLIGGLHLRSSKNTRYSHWGRKADAVKRERKLAARACTAFTRPQAMIAGYHVPFFGDGTLRIFGGDMPFSPEAPVPTWPVNVRLIRIGPRQLDQNNAIETLQAIQDGVADWLGVDDGDETKVQWEYAQEKGQYGVRIEVR